MMDQSRRRALGLVGGGGLALSFAPARAQVPEVNTGARASLIPGAPYTTSAQVRMREDAAARLTVPVRIGDSAPLQFLVDTGADRTTISKATAAALGLPPGEPVTLHGVAGQITAPTVRIASLEVGDRKLTDLVAPVLDGGDLGAAGLLGIDALKDQRLLIDFKNTRMTIQGGRTYPRDPDEVVVRAKARFGQLTLVDAWLGDLPVVVIVDSGAQGSIANSAFRQRVTAMRRKAGPGDMEVVSVTGQSTFGDEDSIPRLRLGGFVVRNLPVIYADLHTFSRWGVDDEPAMLLGVDVLRKFQTVAIDFIKHEVRFRLPDEVPTVLTSSLRLSRAGVARA